MHEIAVNSAFLRDVKRLKRKNYDMAPLSQAQRALRNNDQDVLAGRYRDHQLKGDLREFRELHIQGEWLLIYYIELMVVGLFWLVPALTTGYCSNSTLMRPHSSDTSDFGE